VSAVFTADFQRKTSRAAKHPGVPLHNVILLLQPTEIRPTGNSVLERSTESDQGVKKPSHQLNLLTLKKALNSVTLQS
jgi:hypothetical protein